MIEIRKTLNTIINEIQTETVYILLSSGLDSQSLLFSSLEKGKNVIIVSFTRQDHESKDFRVAKEISEKLSLEFLPVYLPTKLEDISKYSLILGNKYNCKTKTEFECTFPMIFAYKKIKEHSKEKNPMIVSGLGADCYYVISKKGILHFKDKPDEFRKMTYEKDNYCQKYQHEILKKEFNIEHVTPYLDIRIFELFKGVSWSECNKPKQKNPIREQYKEELIDKLYFPHTNYQLGDSRIAELFTQLINTTWNLKNWKSVVGIYNAISKKEITSKTLLQTK